MGDCLDRGIKVVSNAGGRCESPNVRALNFVIHGLLGQGAAASSRLDPEAKSLGEWLRARLVDLPAVLLA